MLIDPESGEEYADNLPSRLMFWGSKTFFPKWCQTPQHWTVKLMEYFWTDCGCCLFFRGVIVGFAVSLAFLALALTSWYLVAVN